MRIDCKWRRHMSIYVPQFRMKCVNSTRLYRLNSAFHISKHSFQSKSTSKAYGSNKQFKSVRHQSGAHIKTTWTKFHFNQFFSIRFFHFDFFIPINCFRLHLLIITEYKHYGKWKKDCSINSKKRLFNDFEKKILTIWQIRNNRIFEHRWLRTSVIKYMTVFVYFVRFVFKQKLIDHPQHEHTVSKVCVNSS